MKKIVLASSSFRRQELMKWLGIPFEIHVSNFLEEQIKFEDFNNPEEYVSAIAMGKALVVADQFPEALIIASDTTVYLDEKIYGKPKDLYDARAMLKTLRGKQHTVFTAVVMIDGETGEKKTEVVKSLVTFFPFSDEMINQYIETSEPYDKAGGYALQGFAKRFIQEVQGSELNVVGFPLVTVRNMLEELGVPIEVDIERSAFEKTGMRT
ncbi:MAG: septum formation protein Maf [Candidatus Pacebacteria bacterium]|nr:septum formation protein Maf [Candidatus Paceibacterota bacterium]